MRAHFEFAFHLLGADVAATGEVDATLALMGSLGWEIRGVTTLIDGSVSVALQRQVDEGSALPNAPELSARLATPLVAPTLEELEREPPPAEEVA